jgi:hypothetical protein
MARTFKITIRFCKELYSCRVLGATWMSPAPHYSTAELAEITLRRDYGTAVRSLESRLLPNVFTCRSEKPNLSDRA